MLAVVGAIIAIIVSIVGMVIQIISVGIYIGKLEGFKELVNFKFDLQDKKLSEHNNFIKRVYELEKKDGIQDEKIEVANHRISDLEDKTNV